MTSCEDNPFTSSEYSNIKGTTSTGSPITSVEETEEISPPFTLQLGMVTKDKWATQGVPTGRDRCAAVKVDDDGNIYCSGYTSSELFDKNSSGKLDVLVVKISPEGNLIWGKQIGETAVITGSDVTQDDQCIGMSLYDGYIYCAGQTKGSFESGVTNGCFAMKMSQADGSITWIKQFSDISCNGIGVDKTGVYIGAGTNGSVAETSGGSNDVFVHKLDFDGTTVWRRQLGGITLPIKSSGNEYCRDIEVDGEGNSYCGGVTSGSFGETQAGNNDIFMVKYDKDGNFKWVSQVGQETVPSGGASENDLCWTVAVNSYGAICGGRTMGSIGATNSGTPVSSPQVDTLLVHFNKNTGAKTWLHQIGSDSSVTTVSSVIGLGTGVCDEVATDDEDNVYCGGRTFSSLFDTQGGQQDSMVYKLDKDANFIWGFQYGGSNTPVNASEYDTGYGMDVSHGQVYVGGETRGSLFEASAGDRDLILFTVNQETGKN